MKIDIPKDWIMDKASEEDGPIGAGNAAAMDQYAFECWFASLTKLANARGLEWLLGGAESHRDSFSEGLSPDDELYELIAESTHSA